MNVLEIKTLTKHYSDFKALDSVSLTVKKGDIYGLVGRNGAGKTTLFKAILGLTNQDSGQISLNQSTDNQSLHDERKHVGFLIGQSFFSYLNAKQNIEYYRRLKGIESKEETQRVLEIVGLNGVDKPFSAYSMGMKQRLGIANAILGNPEIVILDEPINGLDPQGIVDIRNLMLKLNKEFGMTLIVSSHILSELELVANRFGIIDEGKLIQEIDKNEARNNNRKRVMLNTSDNNRAVTLLQDHFGIEVEVTERELGLVNSTVSNEEIVRLLVEQQIGIKSIYDNVESLESVYFELTGGNK